MFNQNFLLLLDYYHSMTFIFLFFFSEERTFDIFYEYYFHCGATAYPFKSRINRVKSYFKKILKYYVGVIFKMNKSSTTEIVATKP